MGKLILVSGENDSGKSMFAEEMIAKLNGKRYYIATMIPKLKENYDRIEKHKKQREGLGFTTLELSFSLREQTVEPDAIVLLEDVSNLLANNLFEKHKSTNEVFSDILGLLNKCKIMVAVTISGLQSNSDDEETNMYINCLNEINKKLYNEAIISVVMKNGKPIYEKGEIYDFN